MSRTVSLAIVVFAAILAPTGCGRAKPEPAPTPASDVAPAPNDDAARLERERLERERLERERAEREAAARTRRAEIERVLLASIHFGFDRFDLTVEARALLESKWTVLSANPSLRLRIEGHADDLGSDEYNLALGMQRAAATKRFFVQRDIAENRIEVVSFGEEQPVCTEASEPCRIQNRRAAFQVISGFETVTSDRGT